MRIAKSLDMMAMINIHRVQDCMAIRSYHSNGIVFFNHR